MRILFLTLFFLGSSLIAADDNRNCISIIVENEAIFNILPFSTAGPIQLIDPQNEDNILEFSLCRPQVLGCATQVFGTLLTDANLQYCDDVAVKAPTYKLLSVTNPDEGISMTFPEHMGQSSEIFYQLQINLRCNPSITALKDIVFNMTSTSDNSFGISSTSIVVEGYSSYGCPLASVSRFNAFLETYKWIFVLIFSILGAFICFFGMKMFNITTFIVTTLAGSLTLAAMFYNYVDLNTSYLMLWIIFTICLILGAGIGILAVRYKKFGFFGLGFGLGMVVGMLFYKYVLGIFLSETPSPFMYIISTLLGIGGGIIALKNWKGMTILSTAIVGAYLVIRAISLVAGGFPGEIDLIKGDAELTVWSYFYLAGIVGLAIAGSRHQFKRFHGLETDDILLQEELAANSRYKEILLDGI
jgi:Domain of unknown function (DUF4203)